MISLLTGYTGFLGAEVDQRFGEKNTVRLGYSRFTKDFYPELILYANKKVQIVHCGASSNRNKIGTNLYKDNWSSLKELVLFTV